MLVYLILSNDISPCTLHSAWGVLFVEKFSAFLKLKAISQSMEDNRNNQGFAKIREVLF